MRIAVVSNYNLATEGQVELPEGKAWEDIESWFVKWDSFHFKLKGSGEWHELEMNSDSGMDSVDYKRPSEVQILGVDGDGFPDWGVQYA